MALMMVSAVGASVCDATAAEASRLVPAEAADDDDLDLRLSLSAS